MMTKIDTTLAKAASVSISRKESTLADYKSNYPFKKLDKVTTEYSVGPEVSLASIVDIKSIATRLGIPNNAVITIDKGVIRFTYFITAKEESTSTPREPRIW